ncbi:MAG TPA: hypothetical protein VET66_09615, partial [Steroidobacteraceae bacterium]|nr:hypothetical protein [Steroidobacteraceae bacterium]
LPLYLLPWVALAFAALRRGARNWRAAGEVGTAWRLAIGAIVPATLLLSLAATARGVYYGPPALGWALLIGLYVGSAATALDRLERGCWRATGWLIALLAVLLGAAVALVAFAPAVRDALSVALGADETSVAMLSLYLPAGRVEAILESNSETATAAAGRALAASGGAARVLWLVPGGVRWELADWFAFLGYGGAPPRAVVVPPAGLGAVRLECLIGRPGGRSFALLKAADAPASEGACR